jgi:hypothetical protein
VLGQTRRWSWSNTRSDDFRGGYCRGNVLGLFLWCSVVLACGVLGGVLVVWSLCVARCVLVVYIRVEDCSGDDDWSTASSEEEQSEEDDEDSDDGDDGEYGSTSSSDEEESEDGEDGDSTTSEDSDDGDDDESTTSGDEESDGQSDDEESDDEDMLRGSGLSAIRLCQRCDVCVADDLEEDSDFGDWWGD